MSEKGKYKPEKLFDVLIRGGFRDAAKNDETPGLQGGIIPGEKHKLRSYKHQGCIFLCLSF